MSTLDICVQKFKVSIVRKKKSKPVLDFLISFFICFSLTDVPIS